MERSACRQADRRFALKEPQHEEKAEVASI
jgi:hypothetical protein